MALSSPCEPRQSKFIDDMSPVKCQARSFQHFKHAKKLGWTLESMTPKVKVKWFYHSSWLEMISPLFGVNFLLFSLGSGVKDASFALKIVNYFNRLFIILVCTLTLAKTFIHWKHLNMDAKWFSVTVILQHLFIALAVGLFVRSKRHILSFLEQLQSTTRQTNNSTSNININITSSNINITGNNLRHRKNSHFRRIKIQNGNNSNKCTNVNFIDKLNVKFHHHLTKISLIWTLIYLTLSITYTWYYLKTVQSKVKSYYSFMLYSIEEVHMQHEILVYFIYSTFVPFVRQNWIVITAGIYLYFIEYLNKVDLLVLKGIKFNKDNYKSQKFFKDPNLVLLNHYKDSLLNRYEIIRLIRIFENIFNPFPFMWFTYNFAEFFLLCRIIIQQNSARFYLALVNYVINSLVLIYVSSRVSQLQSKCQNVARKIILDIESGSLERDEVLGNLTSKNKRNCPPWWTRSSGSIKSGEIGEETCLTNNYKCMLINQLDECTSFCFTGWDTFTVRRTLIIIFIESLVTFTVMILQVSGSLIL